MRQVQCGTDSSPLECLRCQAHSCGLALLNSNKAKICTVISFKEYRKILQSFMSLLKHTAQEIETLPASLAQMWFWGQCCQGTSVSKNKYDASTLHPQRKNKSTFLLDLNVVSVIDGHVRPSAIADQTLCIIICSLCY